MGLGAVGLNGLELKGWIEFGLFRGAPGLMPA